MWSIAKNRVLTHVLILYKFSKIKSLLNASALKSKSINMTTGLRCELWNSGQWFHFALQEENK